MFLTLQLDVSPVGHELAKMIRERSTAITGTGSPSAEHEMAAAWIEDVIQAAQMQMAEQMAQQQALQSVGPDTNVAN